MKNLVNNLTASKSGKIGLFWSYNDGEGSQWIDGCIRAIKTQGFVWWDVGWKINFDDLSLPTTGYMWSTFRKQVKYVTTIGLGTKILKQPDQQSAKNVEKNWNDMKIPFGWNDRLHEYLKGERSELTLLRLSEIKVLNPPLALSDLTLWNGKALSRPPQGANRIVLQ